jgi:putative transposase
MRQTQCKEYQIIEILDKVIHHNASLQKICEEYKISQGTFYKWKNNYEGLNVENIKEVKKLEQKNKKLKKLFLRARREKKILQEAIKGKL